VPVDSGSVVTGISGDLFVCWFRDLGFFWIVNLGIFFFRTFGNVFCWLCML
jgi:hypothetical protein